MRGCLGLFSLTLLSASRLAWSPRVPVFLRPHQIASGKADPGSIRVLFATVNPLPIAGGTKRVRLLGGWKMQRVPGTWENCGSRTPRKKRPRFCRRDSDLWG